MAAFLLEQGLLTPEEAREHPARNQLLAALGVARPEVISQCELPLQTGDRLLLCSDGLWGLGADADLLTTMSAANEPEAAVRTLIARANDAGGEDNITAIAVFITDADRLKGAERAWDALEAPTAQAVPAPTRQRAETPAIDV
jgi:protein phosphatase